MGIGVEMQHEVHQDAKAATASRLQLAVPEAVIQLGCASTACCVADGVCLPCDFLKVRLQLQNELIPAGAPQLGVLGMSAHVLRSEGPLAFFNGLPAAMLRQASYGGLCFSAYPHVRNALNPHAHQGQTAPLWTKLSAGAMTGGISSALANPTDVVKVRLQADGRLLMQGQTPRYKGTF